MTPNPQAAAAKPRAAAPAPAAARPVAAARPAAAAKPAPAPPAQAIRPPAPTAAPQAQAPLVPPPKQEPLNIPFGSPEQQAKEKAAQPAQRSFLPGPRAEVKVIPPFGELTMILFGKPGSGKTVLAASNPGAYFIGLEPGQNFVDAASVEIKNWAEFQHHVAEVINAKKAGQFEYTTAVIDIIDILSGYCYDAVLKGLGLAEMPDDFGRTWKKVRAEWEKWVRGLMRAVNVVFITHCGESDREITQDNGIKLKVSVSRPTFGGGTGGKMGEYLDGIVNAMGHMRIKGNGKHAISFLKDALTDAKDRTNILSTFGEIELSADPKKNWALVEGMYNAKAKELGLTVKSLWTPGQTF